MANAALTISSTAHLVQTASPAGAPSEEEFVLNTDLNTYANNTLAYATQIVNFINSSGTQLREINATVRIANVTAPVPDYQQQIAGQPVAEEEWSFTIGPNDFTVAADLKAVYDTAVAKARSFTNY